MSKIKLLIFFFCAALTYTKHVHSSNLENEAKAVTDTPFSMRTSIYLQARMEYGDLIYGDPADVQPKSFDAYFRRAAIGFYGKAFVPELKYGVSISGDESPENKVYPSHSDSSDVSFDGTYIDYRFSELFSLRFGKTKLPYSRIYLVSSTRQAFSERPYYLYTWENVLKSYVYTNIKLYSAASNQVRYYLSIGKSWRKDDEIYNQEFIYTSKPQLTGRLEWSPDPWHENKLSDTNFGTGQHFTIGAYHALQDDIKYYDAGGDLQQEKRSLYGADISFHKGSLNLQGEINGWEVDSTEAARNKSARGYLLQSSYYIHSLASDVAIRFENFDTNLDAADTDVNKATLGYSYYIDKQKLKVMLDYETTHFDRNVVLLKPSDKSVSNAFRATLQLIF